MNLPNPTNRGSSTLRARVHYPATRAGQNAPLRPAPASGYPTVVFLHGYSLVGSAYRDLGDRLADEKLRNALDSWCVDEPWFDNAAEDCRFMHCLPVRRGVVVSEPVLDGPRSVVIHEARNRMLAQMAVLYDMLGPGA